MDPLTSSLELLPTVASLRSEIPADRYTSAVQRYRRTISDCLTGRDSRLLVVTGPCSIADIPSALEYARNLTALARELEDVMVLVMRTYFQKPRTTVGWKGLIADPYLDGSCRVGEGLRLARELLCKVTELGMPTATEVLDPLIHEYLDDLVSYAAIGARTSESQLHREYSSGLPYPVGFKNAVDGSLDPAINGVIAARHPQAYVGVSPDGRPAVKKLPGNALAHVILRGGKRPNYDSVSVFECERRLRACSAAAGIVVDCSHGNSGKDPARQSLVLRDCISQITNGTSILRGVMLESNLRWGAQKLEGDPQSLVPGLSLTDACICWDTTEQLLRSAAERLREYRRRDAALHSIAAEVAAHL